MLLSGNESKGQKPLSPKTVKLAHGVLHKALEQAVVCGYLASNPADHVKLPLVASIGLDETRFHDLRHSYAINALQEGDSVKEVQEQLGHYSSAFTMDVYAAVSGTMRRQSQQRMENLMKRVSNL